MNSREWGIALLCCALPGDRVNPLTLAQLRTLGQRVRAKGAPDQPMAELRPQNLLSLGYRQAEAEQICRLLDREAQLERYLDEGRNRGIYPLTRLSPEYPKRLHQQFGLDAPPLLFACGEASLLSHPGISLVGSRALEEPGRRFAQRVGELAAKEGCVLISGNAYGADQTAQAACLQAGGSVVAFLADQLSAHPLQDSKRQLFLSEGGYHLPFTATRALRRNHWIHALGEKAFVAQCGNGRGGTWSGTTENLRRGWSEVYVCADGSVAARELKLRGATPVPLEALRSLDSLQPLQQSLLHT